MADIEGLHHVTAIAGDPQMNINFYTSQLPKITAPRTHLSMPIPAMRQFLRSRFLVHEPKVLVDDPSLAVSTAPQRCRSSTGS